jgi:hypothetical protein
MLVVARPQNQRTQEITLMIAHQPWFYTCEVSHFDFGFLEQRPKLRDEEGEQSGLDIAHKCASEYKGNSFLESCNGCWYQEKAL